MIGSQKKIDQRNLKIELIRLMNSHVDYNPRALIQCKCGSFVGHLKYKQSHAMVCYKSLVPDGTLTNTRAQELLQIFELHNSISDSKTIPEMQREATETAEAEYKDKAFRAFCAFADIAARPVLEYLDRYKDRTGEVTSVMIDELRVLALTWESKLESENPIAETNL